MEPGLVRLWTVSFGDSEEFVQGFAEHMGGEDTPVIRYADGVPVSALHLLSCGLRFSGDLLPASYIYAAATLPEYRGRGLMSRLVRASFRSARERGAAVSLVLPASESLYHYYGSFGFTDVFRLESAVLHRDDLEALAKESDGLARKAVRPPYSLYEDWMRQFTSAAVVRSARMFSLGEAECSAVVLRGSGGPDGLCVSQQMGEQVLVKELLADDRHVPLAARSLLRRYPRSGSFQLSLPAGRIPPSLSRFPWTSRPYGMARLLDAGAALELWAKANPGACLDITVKDPILRDNGGNYRIEGGKALPASQMGAVSVNITTLTRLLLLGCDERTVIRRGGLSRAELETHFPVRQPYMNMMLD